MSVKTGTHEWTPSTLGHGTQMCKHCKATDAELAALGELGVCHFAPDTSNPAGVGELLSEARQELVLGIAFLQRDMSNGDRLRSSAEGLVKRFVAMDAKIRAAPPAPSHEHPIRDRGEGWPASWKYDLTLKPFVAMMEDELHANAGKGDRPGWLAMSREEVLLEIYYHLAKLQKAVRNDDANGIREYAADVANMSMMAVDICGAWLASLPPARVEEGPRGDGENRMCKISELVAELQETQERFGDSCVYIRRGGLAWGAVALNRQADDRKHGVFDLQAAHDRAMSERLGQVERLIADRNEWRDRAVKAEGALNLSEPMK